MCNSQAITLFSDPFPNLICSVLYHTGLTLPNYTSQTLLSTGFQLGRTMGGSCERREDKKGKEARGLLPRLCLECLSSLCTPLCSHSRICFFQLLMLDFSPYPGAPFQDYKGFCIGFPFLTYCIHLSKMFSAFPTG